MRMPTGEMLTVIVPCFNEGDNVGVFHGRTSAVLRRLLTEGAIGGYELLFIDDGSGDDTLERLRALAGEDPCVRYLSFTRNFGKEAAMLAGLEHSAGDLTVLMDADLQDPPELLPRMFEVLRGEEGCQCVAARRTTRKGEPPVRSLFARLFYKLINRISDVEIVEGARDFRLMTRRVVDSILGLKEKSRFSKGLLVWAGYRTRYVEYDNVERASGKTKWSFLKLLRYSLDGITAFSVAPLQVASVLGLICCTGAMLAVLFFVLQKLIGGIPVQGYAMLICSLFLLGGLQLLCLGVLGQYLAKVFIESKHRPDYVILESSRETTPASGGRENHADGNV